MADALNGRTRAAAYLRGLDPRDAEHVLAHLSDAERASLQREMSSLDLDPEVCRDIAESEQVRRFGVLQHWPVAALAQFLAAQHAQLSVTILRELPRGLCDAVLRNLPADYLEDLLPRFRNSRRPDPAILQELETALVEVRLA